MAREVIRRSGQLGVAAERISAAQGAVKNKRGSEMKKAAETLIGIIGGAAVIIVAVCVLYIRYTTSSFGVYSIPDYARNTVYQRPGEEEYLLATQNGYDIVAFYYVEDEKQTGNTEQVCVMKYHFELDGPVKYNKLIGNFYADPCGRKRHSIMIAKQQADEDIVCTRIKETKLQVYGARAEDLQIEWADYLIQMRVSPKCIILGGSEYYKTTIEPEEFAILDALEDACLTFER